MGGLFTYDKTKQSAQVFYSMVLVAASLIVFGFLCDTPANVIYGIIRITQAQAGLITDSMLVGGVGAAFVNAGLVMSASILLLRLCRLTFNGISIASLFLMSGFSLFGKDICNIFPIILGGFLYSRWMKERFGRYIYISLFGTALAPVVTEVSALSGFGTVNNWFLGAVIGIVIGFILPPMAAFTLRVHQGYNLYNVGFTAGLIGMILASLLKSFGVDFESRLVWSQGNNLRFSIYLFLLFGCMFLAGFFWNGKSLSGLRAITRHTGRSVADFTFLDGYPVTLMNMGIVGAFSTLYVLAVGGDLNGPTIGGIFTVCGFGSFGKHLKNIIPVMAGVFLSSLFMVWELSDPSVLLAALFSTGLAPIAGQFGWGWGIVAGVIHASVVLNVSFLHGGLNLYNNGFSAGLVCIVLVPLIEALRRESK